MDIKRLRYFCAIIEHGQISRAAKFLRISQPPLSQRLKELEEELGATLIIRDGGQWHVTEAGKELYEQAQKILTAVDEAKRRVQDTATHIGGLVNIGVSTICETKLLTILPRIHKLHPAIQFRIAVADSSRLEQGIANKDLDIAVLALPLEKEEYDARHLPPDGFSVVYHPSLEPQSTTPATLESLTELPLMLSRRWSGGGSYALMIRRWQEHGKTPHIVLDSHNIHTLLRLIEMGMQAAAIVPTSELAGEAGSRLPVRLLAHEELQIYPVIITKKGRFINVATRTVADAIANGFHAVS